MRLSYPRSFLSLLLIGFSIVAAPLLFALFSNAIAFERLADLSEQAVLHCPDSPLVQFNRGVALDHLEQLPQAIASYEKSLALDPTLADAHYNLALLYEKEGKGREAIRHMSQYRRLVAPRPK